MTDPTEPTDPPDATASAASAVDAWRAMVDGLAAAGDAMAEQVADRSAAEQADGFRALLRALHNQLARFEVDREQPELVPFNGWRQKFFMDNPDFRYWVADIRDDRRYRIAGNRGGAAFMSITAYAGGGVADAEADARLDSDSLTFDEAGAFEVTLGGEQTGTGDWMPLPPGARAVWVRQFHDDVAHDRPGSATIAAVDPVDAESPPAFIDPDRFHRRLARLGPTMSGIARALDAATAADRAAPNQVRHWREMQGGAAFTEPGIHYVRGAWQLEPGEALVIEGPTVEGRYWNALLYSRFLNSLDHRHRTVSLTGAHATIVDGRYRLVLAAEDPGIPDWLDTEGRPFGLFVLRWLQPATPPTLPQARVVPLDELGRR